LAEERIRVVIYDDELTAIMDKLNLVRSNEGKVKQTKETLSGIDKLMASKSIKEFMQNIPTLGRAYRLPLTQIPGAREALAMTYRAKMMAAVNPVLIVAILAIYVAKQIQQMWEDIKRQHVEYEDLLREGLDLTHREYMALSKEQTGYASWVDQFRVEMESEGFLNAMVELVWARVQSLIEITISSEEKAYMDKLLNDALLQSTEIR
jgi:hypothetical protein